MDEGDDWEIDEDALGPDFEGVNQGVPVPLMRAVFAKRRLTVLGGRTSLFNDGSPGGMNFASRTRAGVSILELGETESEGFGWELTVGFLADGKRAGAEQALAIWAGRVGYRRIWLPDNVFEPPPAPPVRAIGSVGCPTCGHRWQGRGRRFWKQVWDIRLFPNVCPLCGATMPQWSVRVPSRTSPEELARRSAARKRLRLLSERRRARKAGEPPAPAKPDDGDIPF